MSVSIIKEKSKNLSDLNYVGGEIIGATYINHKESRRRKSNSSVLVLSIQGSHEKFGFLESSKEYTVLSNMRVIGRNAKIYYDSVGKRIEFDVTLHVFDLTLGDYKVIDIAKKRSEGWPVAVIFFSGTLALLIMIIFVLRQFKQKIWESKAHDPALRYK